MREPRQRSSLCNCLLSILPFTKSDSVMLNKATLRSIAITLLLTQQTVPVLASQQATTISGLFHSALSYIYAEPVTLIQNPQQGLAILDGLSWTQHQSLLCTAENSFMTKVNCEEAIDAIRERLLTQANNPAMAIIDTAFVLELHSKVVSMKAWRERGVMVPEGGLRQRGERVQALSLSFQSAEARDEFFSLAEEVYNESQLDFSVHPACYFEKDAIAILASQHHLDTLPPTERKAAQWRIDTLNNCPSGKQKIPAWEYRMNNNELAGWQRRNRHNAYRISASPFTTLKAFPQMLYFGPFLDWELKTTRHDCWYRPFSEGHSVLYNEESCARYCEDDYHKYDPSQQFHSFGEYGQQDKAFNNAMAKQLEKQVNDIRESLLKNYRSPQERDASLIHQAKKLLLLQPFKYANECTTLQILNFIRLAMGLAPYSTDELSEDLFSYSSEQLAEKLALVQSDYPSGQDQDQEDL